MSNRRRTKSGCWTCRLRRKKCDEEGLPCLNCSTRGVFCHGYGVKPSWKDRGGQEKEEASRLQMRSRRRRKAGRDPISIHTDDAEQQFTAGLASSLDSGLQGQSSPARLSAQLPSATIIPVSGNMDFDTLNTLNVQPDSSWTMDLESIWFDPPAIDMSNNPQIDSRMSRDLVQTEKGGQPCGSLTTLLNHLSPQSDSGKRATELVTHFLGETFPLQDRSSQGKSLTDHSWVLNLMIRSSTFNSASLSMSALHYFNTLPIGSEARAVAFQDYQNYRFAALRGLRELMDSTAVTSVSTPGLDLSEPLACAVQIAFLEVRVIDTSMPLL